MADSSNTKQESDSEMPWWVRILTKVVSIIGGFVAIFFAVLGFITFSANGLIAVTLQLFFGLLIIALEAPFCCKFVDFIDRIANFSDSRSFWHKALLYCVMGITPIIICPELNTVLGAGAIFTAGMFYGFMALGKKADRYEMMAASGHPVTRPTSNAVINLV